MTKNLLHPLSIPQYCESVLNYHWTHFFMQSTACNLFVMLMFNTGIVLSIITPTHFVSKIAQTLLAYASVLFTPWRSKLIFFLQYKSTPNSFVVRFEFQKPWTLAKGFRTFKNLHS